MLVNQKTPLLLLLSLSLCRIYAQDTIQVKVPDESQYLYNPTAKLNYKNLVLPAILIGYGVASLKTTPLRQLNHSTKYEIFEHRPNPIRLDNYTQYLPAVMVYGLNAAGIKGEHNTTDRTLIYATSQLITASIVLPLKHFTGEERPDGSNKLSFPSGHTATAFASAQFMYREYRNKNLLLSLSGYPLAIFTGAYRTINNKHWIGDVIAGAGIGILSTELSYWLYPKVKNVLNVKNSRHSFAFAPYYSRGSIGAGFTMKL